MYAIVVLYAINALMGLKGLARRPKEREVSSYAIARFIVRRKGLLHYRRDSDRSLYDNISDSDGYCFNKERKMK